MRALVIALAALAIAAPAASAHATLDGTTPQRGATVRQEPEQVVFSFDEAVTGGAGSVRVFDARGRRVDDARVAHPGGAGPKIGVGLRSGLAKGSYTATYRVVSADGHVVSGGFVFSIGQPGVPPSASVTDLIDTASVGPVTQVAFGAVKAVGYFAIALALGGLLFLWVVWRPALRTAGAPAAAAPFDLRAGRLLAGAAVVGAAATAAGLVLEGATAAGTTFWGALNGGVLGDVLSTHFGLMWALRLAAFMLLGAGLAAARLAPAPAPARLRPVVAMAGSTVLSTGPHRLSALRGVSASAPAGDPPPPDATPARYLPNRPVAAIGFGIVGCALALTPALAGHARTQSPAALLVPADVIHVVAMSAWLGGLAFLLIAVPAATRAVGPAERTRVLAGALSRFSPLALASVLALAATGAAQAIVEVGSIDALTNTAFGRAVLIKAGLLLALITLGAVNRQRVVPRLRRMAAGGAAPGNAGRLLRRTLRAEVVLIVVVLGVTGALTSYPPSTAATANAGPVSVSKRMGPLDLDMTVDPARVGPNAVHLYVFRARDGAPFTGTKEIRAEASLPSHRIGPLKLTLHRAGPGHYVADAATLAPAGDWQIRVTDRVSDFDEYTTAVKAAVR
ncbi:MAG: copper transport protein [Solirubrobacteraceae bacterium]|nr:copper transport protein [Solirubrobacteraceae bacterium]